ncbi:hypothetical protein C8Q80DRAFT_425661 [Daedaleopsis nitida]|nr:hypothetical protein C8Q80DRAFT_425661 [Daedaleopsis nitida]
MHMTSATNIQSLSHRNITYSASRSPTRFFRPRFHHVSDSSSPWPSPLHARSESSCVLRPAYEDASRNPHVTAKSWPTRSEPRTLCLDDPAQERRLATFQRGQYFPGTCRSFPHNIHLRRPGPFNLGQGRPSVRSRTEYRDATFDPGSSGFIEALNRLPFFHSSVLPARAMEACSCVLAGHGRLAASAHPRSFQVLPRTYKRWRGRRRADGFSKTAIQHTIQHTPSEHRPSPAVMKLFYTIAVLAASATCVLAQRIRIGAPAEWTTVTPGESITVRVEVPLTLSSSNEVAVAIGFWPCGGGPCAAQSVDQYLGNVVYKGLFAPQLHESPTPPYENFTVAVPASFQPPMQVSLGVARFAMIGASEMPFMEVANITLNLES